MIGMRRCSALLTVWLFSPYAMPMLCDWVCAAQHQRTDANGSCHQHRTPGTTPTVAAGHVCHDVTSAPASILTDGRQAGFSAPAIVEAPLWDKVQAVLAENRVQRATGVHAKQRAS